MNIGRHILGGSRALVIAELGNNHQGDVRIGQQMIRAAAQAGADVVKIQKRNNRGLYARAFYDSHYNSENAFGSTYGEHREHLEPDERMVRIWQATAAECGVELFSTAFDEDSLEFCVRLGMPAVKLASGSLTDLRLLAAASSSGLPTILSTGGGTLDDVQRAVDCFPATQVAVLQCTASYPCRFEELDLGVVAAYRDRFGPLVGVSLHDNGIAAAVAAYTLGARIVEKHFTLDRTMKGTDHKFSLEPQGFAKLVRDLRRIETALGSVKRIHDSELAPISKMRRGAVASRDLPAGTVLERGDILMRIPGVITDPDSLIGSQLTTDVYAEDPFTEDILCRVTYAAS